MSERKKKVINDLREWIKSKNDILNLALYNCETERDKEYLTGVGDIYGLLDMMVNDYEKNQKKEPTEIEFVGILVNHSSARILDLKLERDRRVNKGIAPGSQDAINAGMIAGWEEVLNFTREMRASINREEMKK